MTSQSDGPRRSPDPDDIIDPRDVWRRHEEFVSALQCWISDWDLTEGEVLSVWSKTMGRLTTQKKPNGLRPTSQTTAERLSGIGNDARKFRAGRSKIAFSQVNCVRAVLIELKISLPETLPGLEDSPASCRDFLIAARIAVETSERPPATDGRVRRWANVRAPLSVAHSASVAVQPENGQPEPAPNSLDAGVEASDAVKSDSEPAMLEPKNARRRAQPNNLPYPSLRQSFKGRSDALEQIHAQLSSDTENDAHSAAAFVIHGLGGIGKTRLTVEYAFRYRGEYSALIFIRAESAAKMRADLAALASSAMLDLRLDAIVDDEAKIAAVLRWLESHPKWLIIFDNVDDAEAVSAVQRWLAKLSGGHVLINGRRAIYPASIEKRELGKLDQPDALEFLLLRTKDRLIEDEAGDQAQASLLVQELGCLPLGLEQAGAYIATEHISFSSYLQLWREKKQILIDWFDRDLMNYDHDTGLAATWATSVGRLGPSSLALLEQLSFFAPDPIPLGVFDDPDSGGELAAATGSARAGLFAYSLISKTIVYQNKRKTSAISVHRLVQNFTRRRLNKAQSLNALREVERIISAASSLDPLDTGTWPELGPLVPHMLAVADASHDGGDGKSFGPLYTRAGAFLRASGRFSEAEQVWRKIWDIKRSAEQPDSREIAASAANLAEVLVVLNRKEEAEPLYREALSVFGAHDERNAEFLVTTLNNYADLLRYKNQKEGALRCAQDSLDVAERYLNPASPRFIRSLINLTTSLRINGQLAKAEENIRRALEIIKVHGGSKHDLALAMFELARTLHEQGPQHTEAEELYRNAIITSADCFEEDHPQTTAYMIGYAFLLGGTGRTAAAEKLISDSIAIRMRYFPDDHPSVREAIEVLVTLFRAMGRRTEADGLWERYKKLLQAGSEPYPHSSALA